MGPCGCELDAAAMGSSIEVLESESARGLQGRASGRLGGEERGFRSKARGGGVWGVQVRVWLRPSHKLSHLKGRGQNWPMATPPLSKTILLEHDDLSEQVKKGTVSIRPLATPHAPA